VFKILIYKPILVHNLQKHFKKIWSIITQKNRKRFASVRKLILSKEYNRLAVLMAARTQVPNRHVTTYLLTPWSRVLLEKLTGLELVKKFSALNGTRRFITVFTSARHLSLSWASSIQSIPPTYYFLKIHFNIILTSTSGSSRFAHQNPVLASPLPHTHYMPRPSHSSRFYHPNSIGWGAQIINPLNPELNPICYLLALLGAHHFLHVSRIRVKLLTLRWLMSYIYGAPILDVSRSHTTTQHSR